MAASGASVAVSIAVAALLGVLQGLTEFIPVSSSGHLVLARWALGVSAGNDQLDKAFDVAVHVGTLFGACVYLRGDLSRMAGAAREACRNRSLGADRLWLVVAISAAPAFAVGAVAESVITERLSAPLSVAIMLIVGAAVLAVADRLKGGRNMDDLTVRDSLLIGVAQAAALAPGVSRSGMTIAAARGLGVDRESAARFSFLASLPLIAGAAAYEGAGLALSGDLDPSFAGPVVAGIATSAISGWVAVGAVIAVVKRRSFAPFVAYRVVLGLVVLVALGAGWR